MYIGTMVPQVLERLRSPKHLMIYFGKTNPSGGMDMMTMKPLS
jgi:hypothetical protein